MANKLYDIIIIGASREGIDTYNSLKRSVPNKSIIVISQDFSKVTSGHSILKADRLKANAVYLIYQYGMLLVTLDNRDLICGKSLIIATGTKPIKLNLDTNNIYYDVSEIKTRAKSSPILVVGNDNRAAQSALALAKKYNYVYICSDSISLNCTEGLANEIYCAKNIAILPLCKVSTCRNNKNGNLLSVTLDTLDTIKCGHILVSIGRIPDTDTLVSPIIDRDQNGFIIVKDNFEVSKVPNIYAIGACAAREFQPRDVTKLVHYYKSKLK